MRSVSTDRAPRPAGHYAQAIVTEGLVFVAGQLPLVPGKGRELPPTVEAQTEQALANVGAILEAAGSHLDRLAQVTIFLADLSLWDRVNATYARVLGDHRPARTVVPTPPLHYGALLEIQAVAALSTAPPANPST